MKRAAILVSVLASLAVLVAAENDAYTPDPEWQVPAAAAAKENPLAGRPDAAAGGRKLFARHCAECHGGDGAGVRHAANLRLPSVQQQTDGALFWKVSNGNSRRGMPSFSGLPEMQRWQLVLHLRSFRGAGAGAQR